MKLILGVLGAGGHGRVIADTATVSGRWSDIIFFDDNSVGSCIANTWSVAGTFADFFGDQNNCDAAIVGIGDNKSRKSAQEKIIGAGIPIATVVHPNAFVSPRAKLGIGVVVFAGVQIQLGADIGNGCIINTSATIDHDCVLGDFVHVSPGARIAGGVVIGSQTWIGIGAVIKEKVVIGKGSIVGAGSVVLNDVPDNTVVVGVPATRKL